MRRRRDEAAGEKQIDERAALRGAAAGDAVEASFVRRREAARALRDVEHDGNACPVELVAQRGQ